MSETKEIKIEEDELKDLIAISERIRGTHQNLGVLREKQMRMESALVHFRNSEKSWEKAIAEKYDLGDASDWKVDAEKQLIIVPVVKEEKEGEE